MPYDDLRSFLETLDKEGQLLRVTDEVMPEPDIAAAANAAPRLGDDDRLLQRDRRLDERRIRSDRAQRRPQASERRQVPKSARLLCRWRGSFTVSHLGTFRVPPP